MNLPTIKVTREALDLQMTSCDPFAGNINITMPTTMRSDKENYDTAYKQFSAVQMMVDHINQDHCGIKLRGDRYSLILTSLSDGADTEQVNRIAKSSAPTTDFFFGPYSSGLAGMLTPVAKQEGILALVAGAASTSVFENNDLAFGTLPPATSYLDEAIAGLAEAGAKTMSYFYENATFTTAACSQVLDLASKHEMQVTHFMEETSQPIDLDLLAAKYRDELDPDVVVACVYNQGCKDWLKAMRRADWSPKAQVFTVCVGDEVLKEEFGQDLYGIIGVTPWDRSENAVDKFTGWNASYFAGQFEASSFVDATYHAGSAAASVVILADAIEKANAIDSQSIADILNKETFQTFFGNISFDEMGQSTKKNLAIQYNENLDIETIFPVQSQSASLLYPMPSWALRDCIFSGCKDCNSDGTCQEDDDGISTGGIVAIVVVLGLLAIGLIFVSYRLHKLAKYTRELEERGEAAPRMSLGRRLTSTRLSLEKVVDLAREEDLENSTGNVDGKGSSPESAQKGGQDSEDSEQED